MGAIGPHHRRRLRELWRSAGWPCRDGIEIELLVAGLLERQTDTLGHETLRVTDAGLALLSQAIESHRAARDRHEDLVLRIARQMQQAGRLVWRGLGLRAKVNGAWTVAMPDVFSIRHTTVEQHLEPAVHEIKVRRSDLLADLRRSTKGAAYRELSSQCWYVIAEGIGQPEEIPAVYGVMLARGTNFEIARPAPRRAMTMPFHVWMALARAAVEPPDEERAQRWLGDPGEAQSNPSS